MNSSDGFEDLEEELRRLGASLDTPAPPSDQVARAVRLRLARPVRPRWGRRIAAAVLAFLVVGVAVTPQGRAAVVSVLRVAGIDIHVGGNPSPPPPESSPRPLPGEHPYSLEQARRLVPFPVSVPEGQGAPDHVTVTDGRVVSLFWGPIRLDEYDGRLEAVWNKMLGEPYPQDVLVGGRSATWIPQKHGVQYLPRGGGAPLEIRLSGPVLIWTRDGTAYRLEGARNLAEASAFAASIR